ncbi:MAG: type II toxin-antitoxin system HicB family antitoxin [Proteobacteria bacterium]|nr:type II toxin-antitoxin system HicB family antitoxin [Pseudomonadota bacterium]
MPATSLRNYSVVLEPDPDGGYVAVVPALPGCYSQGDTVEEALANAREAIELTLEHPMPVGLLDTLRPYVPTRNPGAGPE